jgi:hypothetical protein
VIERRPAEVGQMRDELAEAALLLLQRDAEVPDADLIRLRHLPL